MKVKAEFPDKLQDAKYFVYLYRTPNGQVFYVGKGLRERALSLSPSRRNKHFMNTVRKHSPDNIYVELIPCLCEGQAFNLEKIMISFYRERNGAYANYTDGGEGCSGRIMTEAQSQALEKGRCRHKDKNMSQESLDRMKSSSSANLKEWHKSGKSKDHLARLAEGAKEWLHRKKVVECIECGESFETRSAQAKNCSRRCEQRNRRRRQKVASQG